MPIYKYTCTNKDCKESDSPFEKMCKIKERNEQVCKACDEPVKLVPSTNSGKHISWSLWRV